MTIGALFLNLLIAAGQELLKKEEPEVVAVGTASIDLGEQALSALVDGSTPLAQKELEWKQQKDIVMALVAKCKDAIPSLAMTLLSDLEEIAFEELL